jgi:predicted transcriptional regulator
MKGLIKMETRVVTAHIPVGLAKEVDALSERLDRPKGWIIKQALAAWVGLEAKRHQLTLEALADVDTGRTVDHKKVEEWSKTLGKTV